MSDSDNKAFHQLWAELDTRIATRAMPYRAGVEEAAIANLFELSQIVRGMIKDQVGDVEFHKMAKPVFLQLTRHLEQWHPRLQQNGQFKNSKDRHLYRIELVELQENLSRYRDQLAMRCGFEVDAALPDTNSGNKNPTVCHSRAGGNSENPSSSDSRHHGNDISSVGLNIANLYGDDFPPQEIKLESRRLEGEEANAACETEKQKLWQGKEYISGLALSGGGIRSATFSLGVIQVLQKQGYLEAFDYLSTVSGGGYLGAYLTGSIARQNIQNDLELPDSSIEKPQQKSEQDARAKIYSDFDLSESSRVRHLRNNSKYLVSLSAMPIRVLGILLNGLLASTLALASIAALCGLLLFGVNEWIAPYVERVIQSLPLLKINPNETYVVFQLIAILSAAALIAYFITRPLLRWPRLNPRVVLDKLSLVVGFVLFAALLAIVIVWLSETKNIARLALPAGAFSMLLTPAVFGFFMASKFLKQWGPKMLSLLAFLIGPFVFVALSATAYSIARWNGYALIMLTLAACIWLTLLNVNYGGIRSFYRNRLAECYGKEPGDPHSATSVALSKLPERPYHLINAVINAPISTNIELRGRDCDFFVFSKYQIGSRLTGYQATESVELADRKLDLMTAVAISGAAASTNMGRRTMQKFRFLLTLFNIRLGYWFKQNPPVKESKGLIDYLRMISEITPWPNATHLTREALGWLDECGKYVNLSDGGHIENLAVYELLRRRTRFIVCVDGGNEPDMSCFDLMRLQRYAKIDFGIELEFDLSDLTLQIEKRITPSYGTMVKIIYPSDTNQACIGWMLFLKLTTIGTESNSVKDYQRTHPIFPHESTADQFFDEDQFEAYRQLGEEAGSFFFNRAFKTEEAMPFRNWMQALAKSLGPL